MPIDRKRFPSILHVPITEEMEKKLKSAADNRGIPKSVLVRELLRDGLKVEGVVWAQDLLRKLIAESIKEQLWPVEERLAKINAKSSYASAISLYIAAQAIFDMGKRDTVTAFQEARKKAIQLVQEKIPHTGDLEKWVLEAKQDAMRNKKERC